MFNAKNQADFDLQRQVLQASQQLMKEYGLLGAIALKNLKESDVITGAKLERKEMVYSPVRLSIATAITSGYFDNTPKDVIVVAGAIALVPGQKITFQTVNKTSKGSLTIIVDSITNDTTFKAIKVGGANVAISVGDIAIGGDVAKEEGFQDSNRGGLQTPMDVYNYTQIIRVSKSISGTMAETNNWDFKRITNELIKQAVLEWNSQFNSLVSSPSRANLTISGKSIKIAGGLPFFMENNFNSDGDVIPGTPSNVVDAGGAKITMRMVNLAFKYAIDNDGTLDSIRCGSAQALSISEFEANKVNVNLITGDGSVPTTVGGAVQVLKSPIKVGEGMVIKNIFVDPSMAVDEVEFFNSEKIVAIPRQNRALFDYTILVPDADNDNYRIRMAGEWSIYIEQVKANTFKYKNLSTDYPMEESNTIDVTADTINISTETVNVTEGV